MAINANRREIIRMQKNEIFLEDNKKRIHDSKAKRRMQKKRYEEVKSITVIFIDIPKKIPAKKSYDFFIDDLLLCTVRLLIFCRVDKGFLFVLGRRTLPIAPISDMGVNPLCFPVTGL